MKPGTGRFTGRRVAQETRHGRQEQGAQSEHSHNDLYPVTCTTGNCNVISKCNILLNLSAVFKPYISAPIHYFSCVNKGCLSIKKVLDISCRSKKKLKGGKHTYFESRILYELTKSLLTVAKKDDFCISSEMYVLIFSILSKMKTTTKQTKSRLCVCPKI